MIITFWKGVFVADSQPSDHLLLKKAGFTLHENSLCKDRQTCKGCRAKIGHRYWTPRLEDATRLKSYCNDRALKIMKEHLSKLAKSRALNADIFVPAPSGLTYAPYQKAGIAYMIQHKDTLVGDDPGLGKDQPLTAKILTPTGWTLMGDIKTNDLITGADGKSYHVIGVYPQGLQKVYKITFNDNSFTECGENHLWKINTGTRIHRNNKPLIWPLSEFKDSLKDSDGKRKYHVQLIIPEQSQVEKKHFIDPYVLGYLLGNGGLSQSSVRVTIPEIETVDRINSLLTDGVHLSKQTEIDYILANPFDPGKFNPLLSEMKRLNLMGHLSISKFIPQEYLWSTLNNRISLLQGILDADAHARPLDGNIEYSSSSPQLAKDVQHLIQSLGGTAKIRKKKTPCHPSYRMSVRLPNNIIGFRLSRKLKYRKPFTKYPPYRIIESVEYIGLKETQCISVDSPDHLYVTDDFIVTHNTIESLGFINILNPKNVLVICPTTLSFNWRLEASKWLVKPMKIFIPTSGRTVIPKEDNLFVIINYEKASACSDLTESMKRIWDVIICDEAHALKTPGTKRTQAILTGKTALIRRSHRALFLTGTPIENYPKEIWTIAATICPVKFGDENAFKSRYCGLHEEPTHYGSYRWVDTGHSHLGELQQRLRASFMVRRLKRDVLKELPPKRRQLIVLGDSEIDWTAHPDFKRWKDLYEKDYEARLAALEAAKTFIEYRKAVKALEEFTGVAFQDISRMRHETALAKLPLCIKYIDDMLEAGLQKLVIFAHHKDVLQTLAEHYGDRSVSLYGDTKQSDRESIVQSFQNGPKQIFIGGLKAAGMGLNLFAASTVVFIEIDWNPAVLTQAEDRLCRIGQKNMVHVIHLVLDGTLDVNMSKKVIEKQNVVDKALDYLPEQERKPTQLLLENTT